MGFGFGFGEPPRQESQVVKSSPQVNDDYNKWLEQWTKSWGSASAPVATNQEMGMRSAQAFTGSGGLDKFFADQAAANPATDNDQWRSWYKDQYVQDVGPTIGNHTADANSQQFIQGNDALSSGWNYDQKAAEAAQAEQMAALQREKAAKDSEYNAWQENNKRTQSAYNQMSGGGFTGGLINDSYADPFSNLVTGLDVSQAGTDPGMPSVAMPWMQTWGQAGYGGPGQNSSVGAYSPNGFGSASKSTGGFGGVFGARNPWSPV